MENIDRYIEKVDNFISLNPGINEDMIIRYVYLDLGNRLSFNTDYIPFGNSKRRQEIYRRGFFPFDVDKCLETNIVTCNSVSKLLEFILGHYGINIRSITAKNDYRKCPHVYNVITPKDGREEYTIDLQEDMYRIQMHGFTVNYGLSYEEDGKYVVSRFEQEQMDRRLGYIDSNNYYTDDYLYLLRQDTSYIEDFYLRVKFILENIEVYDNPNIKYIDRQWYHVKVLEQFFKGTDFDYACGTGKIKIVDCYKDIDNVRHFINCVLVEHKGLVHVFMYNMNKGGYQEIGFDYFINAIRNGLVIHRIKIREVEKALRKKAQ